MSFSLNRGVGRIAAGMATAGGSEGYQAIKRMRQGGGGGAPDMSVSLPELPSLRDEPRGRFETMLRDRAMQTGINQPRQFELNQQLQGMAGQGRQGMENQMSQMAQTGGITQSARERLAKASQESTFQAKQGARQQAVGGSIEDRLRLEQGFAQQEGTERQQDIANLLKRQELDVQLESSRNLAQAQLDSANKPDALNRMTFGIV